MILVGGQLARQLNGSGQFPKLGVRNESNRKTLIGGNPSAAMWQIDKSASQRLAKDARELRELRNNALGIGQPHRSAHTLPCQPQQATSPVS
jgi:hypothetical protein